MHRVQYYADKNFTPTFLDVLKGAKQVAFGTEAEVTFAPARGPGPGVLCFGVGTEGILTPTANTITASADGLSLLVRALKLAAGVIATPKPHEARVVASLAELDVLGQDIVVDIETRGDIDGPKSGLSFLCIGIWDGTANPVMLVPAELCTKELGQLLSTRRIINHHSAFDIAVMNALWGTKLRPHADTMVLHYAMHPASASHGLKSLARYYLGVDDWDHDLEQYTGKGKKKDYGKIPLDVLYRYCALDVYYTGLLLAALTDEASDDSKRFYEQRMIDNNFLIEVEEGPGVFIDVPYFERLYDNIVAELDLAVSKMRSITEEAKFNPGSHVQVKAYLARIGTPVKNTEAKTLEALEQTEFIALLLEYKKTLKTRGFVQSMLEKNIDGYLHPQFKIARTSTGRLASASINIQQIPRSGPIKGGIVAPPGYKIVTADYSQVENRIMAVLSGDPNMVAAFQPDSPDFFDALAPAFYPEEFPLLKDYETYKAAQPGGEDKFYRAKIKGCVPLTTKILTKRGWLSHDEVRVGDQTPGLVVNGVTEWTTVREVLHWDSKPIYKLGHARWNVEVTENHRWATLKTGDIYKSGTFDYTMQETRDIELKTSSLIVAGKVEDAARADLTVDEVRLIAWIASDGYLKISSLTGTTSQGLDGRRRQFNGSIYQAKTKYVTEIRDLLVRLGADFTESTIPGVNYDTHHTFKLRSGYLRELYNRADLVEQDFCTFVLTLGTEQREAYLDTFCAAEGYKDASGAWMIGQNAGNKQDSIVLAATLLGYRTTLTTPEGVYSKVRLSKVRHVGLTTAKLTYLRDAPVWCVVTDNGTWTAHDGDKPFVTGNCVYGLAFGRGAAAIGSAVGSTKEYAQQMIDNYAAAYPRLFEWRETIKTLAIRAELTAWTGMPFEAEIIHWRNRAELERSGLSFMPQHHANQLMLNGARAMHEALDGRGWIHAVVHDAAYLYVKEEHAEQVACELEQHLVDSGKKFFGDAVLFAAQPKIGDNWSEV